MTRETELPLSPEFRLLAAALRPPTQTESAVALVQASAGDLDWAHVLRLAERHRVVPGLAAGIARAGVDVPAPYGDRLRDGLALAAFQELALAGTTKRILRSLTDAGIEVAVLKGVPLSLIIHGRLGLRTSRDIDLIVAPDAVARALEILEGEDFQPIEPVGKGGLRALIRHRKDIELISPHGGQIVELHWRLFDNPYLMPLVDAPAFASVSLPLEISCLTLPARFNLLYLANHGAQHAWSRLKWLADLAALLHPLGEAGREALYAGTSIAEGRRSLGQALLLCADLFGMPPPPGVLRDIRRDWRLRWLHRQAIGLLTRSADREIESIPFGSTAKNFSHYLILSAPRYLVAEAAFDFTQFSSDERRSGWHLLGPIGRLSTWLKRKGRPAGKSQE